MNPWKIMEREMEILRVEDALGSLGFYQSLRQKGLNAGDSIPEEDRRKFYESYLKGRAVPHLVAPCYSRTVSKEVVHQFNELFQIARQTVASIIDEDASNDDLRSKWKSGDFKPGEDYTKEQLLKECVYWYRARQLRMNRPDVTHQDVFNTVRGELEVLMEDMKGFIDNVVMASMVSFASFMEEAGYRPIDANAIDMKIVTLHSRLGIIVGPPEEDGEKIRDNDNIMTKREKKNTPSTFDPSYM